MRGRWAILTASAVLWFGGCTTIRSTATPVPRSLEYRETQAKIQQQQTEIAVTGVRIEESGQGIIAGIETLETSLGDPNYDRDKLITQARDLRVMAEDHQTEIKSLNLMLVRERETTRLQGELFDKREEAWQQELSGRAAENAALMVENKKLAGQRNTLLAIVLTIFGIILIIITFKVLRVLKIIPY
jgi:hypothetical protein